MTETMTATRISFELVCSPECAEFAGSLFLQMSGGKYDECAVLRLPEGDGELDRWRQDHRTARKRADRAVRRGYRFVKFDRSRHAQSIFEINTSADHRQGRPMSDGYRLFPTEEPLPHYPCWRHAIRTWGVEDRDGKLIAYSFIYRCGDLALVSQILGHAEHLENEVMYLLVEGIIDMEGLGGPGFLVYNRWDSGTDGLRFFKERLGFAPVQVEWLP
jgi:hypothetical protein